MGMDLSGWAPTNKAGEYFRRNNLGWYPLADLAVTLCRNETAPCQYWYSNDYDGLDAAGALALANALHRQLLSGAVGKYIENLEAQLASLPDEPCSLCDGTGVQDIEQWHVMRSGFFAAVPDEPGCCLRCHGRGTVRPIEARCSVSEDDVREFIAFLRDSGGFSIG